MSDDNVNQDNLKLKSKQVTIYIDDVAHQVNPDNNLLAGVLSEKINLPYFCWHPSMGSVGACRQCAVTQFQDKNDSRGRLVMSCMTPVTEGMRISLKDNSSEKFREQVIGAMMTNHPHDCPVCAEGGECHLQDMTVMTGHTTRKYQGSKRTFTNQYLGELVGHEMNRCITCYRCERFYKDYAGGDDFGVYGSANHVYFGRQSDGELESEFSGNLVEVCPTGVFTNKLFSAHYTRKWDLQSAPSVCAHCSIGCNTSIGERYGSVRRVVNRFNHDINGYFLCDRGRFGIGFVNSDKRIRQTKGIDFKGAQLTNLDLAKSLIHFRGQKFIGVGSERASLEANFYLKQLVGSSHFCAGLSNKEMALAAQHQQLIQNYQAPSLAQVEQSDLVIIIGEDITQTSPRMALSVRQALRNKSVELASAMGIPSWQDAAVRTIGGEQLSPLFSINSMTTKLDGVSKQCLILPPDTISNCLAVLNEMLMHLINGKAIDLSIHSLLAKENLAFVKSLVSALLVAKKPLIITGWSLQSAQLFEQINQCMTTLHSEAFCRQNKVANKVNLAVLPRECNSIGLLSMIDYKTASLDDLLDTLAKDFTNSSTIDKIDGVVLLEQELGSLTEGQIKTLRRHAKTLIVLDHSQSSISELADIVLPVAAVSEGDGHYVNYQGVVQRYHQVHPPILPIQDSWRWLDSLANCIFSPNKTNKENLHHHSLKELNDYLNHEFDDWPINEQNIDPLNGMKNKGVARQTHRASGRTAQMANISVHESKTTQSAFDRFNFSMEGLTSGPSSTHEMPFTWAPGWNSNQSINQYQSEVGGTLLNGMEELRLSVNASETLIDKWSVSATNVEPFNSSEQLIEGAIKEDENQGNAFIFVNQTSWHQGDWQTHTVPEFTQLHKVNTLSLSKQHLDEQGWQEGQYLALSFELSDDILSTLAILKSVDNMPKGLAFAQIFELSAKQTNLNLNVTLPSNALIVQHQQKELARLEQATVDKDKLLKQLKINDQCIPIRLVSGGLDDV